MQVAEQNQQVDRVPLSAFVDRDQRDKLAERARREDRSVSSLVRAAVAAELERWLTGREEEALESVRRGDAAAGGRPEGAEDEQRRLMRMRLP